MPSAATRGFRSEVMLPATTRRKPADAAAITVDVAHAWEVAESYTSELPGGCAALQDARVLEVGPGPSLGAAVLLACYGARISVADPYLADWDDGYHLPFFRALLRSVDDRHTAGLDGRPILRLLEARRFVEDVVTILKMPIESLECPDAAFDLVVSCAVLEHVRDVPRALEQLARITTHGGLGVHVVDFRDHRDFTRPLEYLTLDAPLFWCMFDARWGECGNRWRHSNMGQAFEAAGFGVTLEPFSHASMDYVGDVRLRLHEDFRGLNTDELTTLVGRFCCRRVAERTAQGPSMAPAWLPPAPGAPLPSRLRGYRHIAIYGAGSGALAALDLLERLDLSDRVIALCDGSPAKVGTVVCGFPVTRFDALGPPDHDLVVVASEPGRADISTRLIASGLTEVGAFRELGFIGAFARANVTEAVA